MKKFFVVKQTRIVLIQAETEIEALDRVTNPLQEMRGDAVCIREIEAENDFQAFEKATLRSDG